LKNESAASTQNDIADERGEGNVNADRAGVKSWAESLQGLSGSSPMTERFNNFEAVQFRDNQ
jgi:hypothetical protein